MIEFEDGSILAELTLEDGGAVEFTRDGNTFKKGYSLFLKSEESGDIFEVILSEEDLKAMLKEIKENL